MATEVDTAYSHSENLVGLFLGSNQIVLDSQQANFWNMIVLLIVSIRDNGALMQKQKNVVQVWTRSVGSFSKPL